MALSALHVMTAIFSATWSPSGDLGPRSTPIRSIFATLPALSPSATASVSAAGRCFGTWAHLRQRMFCFAGRLRNTIWGWSSLLICVPWSKRYKSRLLFHILKDPRPRFAVYCLRETYQTGNSVSGTTVNIYSDFSSFQSIFLVKCLHVPHQCLFRLQDATN